MVQELNKAAQEYVSNNTSKQTDIQVAMYQAFQAGANWYKNIIDNFKVYLKIPMTTEYSDDLSFFDEEKRTVVEGTEFNEKDHFGDDVCCWYVSTVIGAVKEEDKQWLLSEISELGCNPSTEEVIKGLFKVDNYKN